VILSDLLDLAPASPITHPTLLALIRQAQAAALPAVLPAPDWRVEACSLVERHLLSVGVPADCLHLCRFEIAENVAYASIVVSVTFHYPALAPIALRVHLLGDGVRYHGTRHLTRHTNDLSCPFFVALPDLRRDTEGWWSTYWAWNDHDSNAAPTLAHALRLASERMQGYHECLHQQDFRNSPDIQELGLTFEEEE
jgi:hypothetical protein